MKTSLIWSWLNFTLCFMLISLISKPTTAELIQNTVVYAITLFTGLTVGNSIGENESTGDRKL